MKIEINDPQGSLGCLGICLLLAAVAWVIAWCQH